MCQFGAQVSEALCFHAHLLEASGFLHEVSFFWELVSLHLGGGVGGSNVSQYGAELLQTLHTCPVRRAA